jgi:uncharacterized membrane protein YphA (DoxX/SURF4 family)
MIPTPTVTTSSTATWPRRALTGLCWLLAISFVAGGLAKFVPGATFAGEPYSEKFAEWGYPPWFRFVVGAGEVVGAVLLVVPRRRLLGAALLGVILVGAVLTHIVNGDPLSQAVMAPICLALVAIVAYAHGRPRRWQTQDLLLRGGEHG